MIVNNINRTNYIAMFIILLLPKKFICFRWYYLQWRKLFLLRLKYKDLSFMFYCKLKLVQWFNGFITSKLSLNKYCFVYIGALYNKSLNCQYLAKNSFLQSGSERWSQNINKSQLLFIWNSVFTHNFLTFQKSLHLHLTQIFQVN